LLSDNLEPQILRGTKKRVDRGLLLAGGMAFLWGIILIMLSDMWFDFKTSTRLLASLMCPVLIIMAFLGIASVDTRVSRWVFPSSAFLWGEELSNYQSRQARRRNWTWGILIAFVVSLSASIVAGVMQSGGNARAKDPDYKSLVENQQSEIYTLRRELSKLSTSSKKNSPAVARTVEPNSLSGDGEN
jgi:hypothetical protein